MHILYRAKKEKEQERERERMKKAIINNSVLFFELMSFKSPALIRLLSKNLKSSIASRKACRTSTIMKYLELPRESTKFH